jgi:UDP-4-amino-4,6-dideoxy-N-acetyl-beta-L-altrosamine transaminase
MIPYSKQSINEKDIHAVSEVLKSDYLTTGPKIKEFEDLFAKKVGSKYAIAVSNGTAALHLACITLNLKEGDEVICTPMTFVASINCVIYCGATPIFVDIDESGLMDASLIEDKITNKTKAIIPVHYSGINCDMLEIKRIADKYNLKIIEDACHALDSKYKNTKTGSCTYSDISIFSFHPVKHITTGEGGMITTNSEKTYKKLSLLRTHGITKNHDEFENKSEGSWYYEMQELGFNYRITDFQCALGINQLKRLNEFVKKRKEIAKKYDDAFKNNENIETLKFKKHKDNSYHLYVIKVKDKDARLKLFNYLKEKEVFCQVHYIPVHLQPYFKKKFGYKEGDLPQAEKFYERIISLPMYPDLEEEELIKIIKMVNDFLNNLRN